jgi:hypothetical protein
MLEVVARGELKLPYGLPLVPRVGVTASGGELTMSLELRGSGGETLNDVRIGDYERPPAPKVRILDVRNHELALLNFHYG